MAHLTSQSASAQPLWHILAAPLESLRTATLRVAEARARAEEVETLMSLSDADLAARDLTREDIVPYVANKTYFV